MPTIHPTENYILIVPSQKKKTTEGGLVLPTSVESVITLGEVIAVGKDGSIKVGDNVAVPTYAISNKLKNNGVDVALVLAEEVIAVIKD